MLLRRFDEQRSALWCPQFRFANLCDFASLREIVYESAPAVREPRARCAGHIAFDSSTMLTPSRKDAEQNRKVGRTLWFMNLSSGLGQC